MKHSDQKNAEIFLNEKAREFKGEFSALFLSYDVFEPPTGKTILELITKHGREFSTKVDYILKGKFEQFANEILSRDNSNFLGIGSGKWKAAAQKGAELYKNYKDGKAPEQSGTGDEKAPTKTESKKILGLSPALAIGIGAVILLTIIFIIIKKARA